MQPSIQTKPFLALFDADQVPALPLDTERAAIVASQKGDKKATLTLLATYSSALRGGLREWASAVKVRPSNEALDEARSAIVLGALESIQKFDITLPVEKRLAITLPEYVRLATADLAVNQTVVAVPARTLRRYNGIMRKAENDPIKGAVIAPEHDMKTETFLAVHEAVRNVDSINAAEEDFSSQFKDTQGRDEGGFSVNRLDPGFGSTPKWDSGFSDAEDRILIEAALSVLDGTEKDIIGMAYGFAGRPLPDSEIATLLFLSRQKVQRLRAAALTKMRDRLGAL